MIDEETKKMVVEWAQKNGCTVIDGRYIRVYKTVHKVTTKDGPRYISDWAVTIRAIDESTYVIPRDHSEENIRKIMEYKIGEYVFSDKFDPDPISVCSSGLHVASRNAAFNYGRNWSDGCIIELEIDLNDKDLYVVLPMKVEQLGRGMSSRYSFTYLFGSEQFRVSKARVVGEIGCIYSRSVQRFINGLGQIGYDFEDSEKAWGVILDILDGVFTTSGNGRMHAASFKYLGFIDHETDIADAALNFFMANTHPYGKEFFRQILDKK